MRKNGLRNLPTMEQPYEKCLENGPESLSDAELLAVILRCGARGKTSLELAREILSLPGKEEGLLGLYTTCLTRHIGIMRRLVRLQAQIKQA